MPKKKKSLLRIILRVLLGLLLLLVLAVIAVAVYVTQQKNELAQQALQEVNKLIVGEVVVESIALGDLFSYPDLEITLKNVTAYEYKRADTLTDAFLLLDEIKTHVNIQEVLEGNYQLPFAHLTGGELYLHRKQNGEVAIRNAFLPIHGLHTDSSKGGFALFIDTVRITDLAVRISADQLAPQLDVQLDSVRANFSYAHSHIGGLAKIFGHTAQLDMDSTSSIAAAPLSCQARYGVGLQERLVEVRSNQLNALYTDFGLDFTYDYSKNAGFDVKLKTTGKGISLQSQSVPDSLDIGPSNLRGFLDTQLNLSWRASRSSSFAKAVLATLIIESENIVVNGIDLDNYINKYSRSQNFNLLDVGAIMLAGPAGIAITKGTDYTRLLTSSPGDSSNIAHLVANWRLQGGKLEATDLAFNTASNLMAATCTYDVLSDSLDMKVLVIDKRGCTMASQSLYGRGSDLKSSRVKLLKTLLGPVTNFFRDIGLGKCKPEYTGSVVHPNAVTKK